MPVSASDTDYRNEPSTDDCLKKYNLYWKWLYKICFRVNAFSARRPKLVDESLEKLAENVMIAGELFESFSGRLEAAWLRRRAGRESNWGEAPDES
jgi:hypothetical protein